MRGTHIDRWAALKKVVGPTLSRAEEFTLAGFTMTVEDWAELDEESLALLLEVLEPAAPVDTSQRMRHRRRRRAAHA